MTEELNFIELQELRQLARAYLYGYLHAKQFVTTDKPASRDFFRKTRLKVLLKENENFLMPRIPEEVFDSVMDEVIKEEWGV